MSLREAHRGDGKVNVRQRGRDRLPRGPRRERGPRGTDPASRTQGIRVCCFKPPRLQPCSGNPSRPSPSPRALDPRCGWSFAVTRAWPLRAPHSLPLGTHLVLPPTSLQASGRGFGHHWETGLRGSPRRPLGGGEKTKEQQASQLPLWASARWWFTSCSSPCPTTLRVKGACWGRPGN